MLASGRYALMLLLFATFPVLDRMLRDGGRPDLDRIVSRTLAYGLLTVLLGLGYAGVVLGLGRLLGRNSSLAVAAAFQPLRRRVQGRWTGASTAAATTPAAPSSTSPPASATRWTWTRCTASWWSWSTRPCSPPGPPCGSGPPADPRRSVAVLVAAA